MKQKILILCSSLLMLAFFLFPQTEVQANPETPGEPVEMECQVEIIPCPPGSDALYRQMCHMNGDGVFCVCGQSTVCNTADIPPKDAIPGG